MAKTNNQYPVYALKSDDDENQQNQYPAYASNQSDDGKTNTKNSKNRSKNPLKNNTKSILLPDLNHIRDEKPNHTETRIT